jgi:hypothetical protein
MDQLSIDWTQQRDAGMAKSASHAESIDPGWLETAYTLLNAYCIQHRGQTFTSEDWREWAEARGFPIPVPKALGSVFSKAAKRGLIRRVGFAIARERHGSPCPQWLAA